ncbi:hypothetical protein VTL71DRAFT_4554 [Oculimacula yallundae]|uniref:Uncharacterized protein n=1 Tax=Oculimacula yallundae TaxID=86028 RepID=A0ABR4C2Y7_9HELO
MSEEIVFDYSINSVIAFVGVKVFAESTRLEIRRNKLERSDKNIPMDSVTGLSGVFVDSRNPNVSRTWTIRLDWDEQKGDHWNVDIKDRTLHNTTTRKLAFVSMSRSDYERGRLSNGPSPAYEHMIRSFGYAAGVVHDLRNRALDDIVYDNGDSVAATSLRLEFMARTQLYGEPDWSARQQC